MLILWIVWAALTSTVFVCGTVAWFMPAAGHLADPEKTRALFTGLALFSGVLLTAALMIRIRTCRVSNIQKALREFADGRTSLAPSAEEQKDIKAFGDSPAETAVARHIFNGCAISWALAEAVAIHGFGLSHMSGNRTMYVSFALPALLFLLWARPPRTLIRDEIARFEASH
jgi:hypothetical protein